RLAVERRIVVRARGDLGGCEMLADPVTLRRADDVDVVDVTRLVLGQVAYLAEPELRVARRGLAPQPVPLLDVRQKQPRRSGLELVEPRVVADELEVLLRLRAVEPQEPDPLRQLLVAGRDEPRVAEREQVLGREEAVGRDDAGLPDALRAERLRGVLDD